MSGGKFSLRLKFPPLESTAGGSARLRAPGLDADVEIDARDHPLKSGKATIQAKVAAKARGQLAF